MPALGPGHGHEADRAGRQHEPERGERPAAGEHRRGAGVGDSVCVAYPGPHGNHRRAQRHPAGGGEQPPPTS